MSELSPIVGYRCWIMEAERPVLRSVAMRYEWPTDTAVAKCMNSPKDDPPKHTAPWDNCRCGLHARTTLAGCTEEYPYYPVHGYWAYQAAHPSGLMIMGAVLLWGDTHRGEKVIRSQYGKVLCLTDKPDVWAERMGSNNPTAISQERRDQRAVTLVAIQEAYGVPMIEWDGVEMYASEFGDKA